MRNPDMRLRRLLLAVLAAAALLLGAPRVGAELAGRPGLLDQIKSRGYVSCGVAGGAPGFSQHDENGEWSGFDVDFCRALAAAIFDDATKVRFTAIAAKELLTALQAGWVDLLGGGVSWIVSRDTSHQALLAAISYFDGQGFLVRAQKGVASARELGGLAVCVQEGTSQELELVDYSHARKVALQARPLPSFEEAAKAYESGTCDALTAELSDLYATRAKLQNPTEHVVLADLVAKSARGPIVRYGDDRWFNLVRWTLFAMVNAEELDVSRATADEALKSEDPNIRRLLGVDGDLGAGLQLPRGWAFRIVRHVGNYGEVFERNLGRGSALSMERRQNALWTSGGLMFAPPVR